MQKTKDWVEKFEKHQVAKVEQVLFTNIDSVPAVDAKSMLAVAVQGFEKLLRQETALRALHRI